MKKQLKKSNFSKLAAPGQELPDEAIRCFATLILFHCDISANHEVFAFYQTRFSPLRKDKKSWANWIYQAAHRVGKYDNIKFTLILIENKVKNGSGRWFHFIADFKIYDIPVLLCNSSREPQRVRWDKKFLGSISLLQCTLAQPDQWVSLWKGPQTRTCQPSTRIKANWCPFIASNNKIDTAGVFESPKWY